MRFRLGFIAIAWLYLALAALYALNTPRWEVPDEPAHYNYVRTIAEQGALPVLQTGDYDQAYLEQIKAQKFPPSMPIDGIRYEAHQPPSYYLLAAPLYKLGEGTTLDARLMSLRLYTALWGILLLALAYRLAMLLFPTEPLMPLLACALVAFVPQHLAMEAGINNDALAEVVLAGIVLALVRISRWGEKRKSEEIRGNRTWAVVGVLAGLGFLTKTTTYISVGLIVVTLWLLWRQSSISTIQSLLKNCHTQNATRALLIALLIGSFWFARNAVTYGPTDWLGLQRHNAVVVGQPRTLDHFPNYLVAATSFFPTLFRSFWGQFGWMGVPLDARIYDLLLFFTILAFSGLALYKIPNLKPQLPTTQPHHYPTPQLLLLLAWFLFTFVSTIAYSLEFYQAQGRYLFPALGALALFMAMGLRAWLRVAGALSRRVGIKEPIAEWALFAMLVIGLVGFDWLCLYRFIIPQLR